ncbi:MAG: protein-disulfide reductase DsbD family protein [Chthoniobacteraceae bacterium]|nr:protein-disulfide reductase DsbD family protein [Chthoniobacteraceae bacterium]
MAPTVRAELALGNTPVAADLVAETTAAVPGKPFTAALRLRMAPGWHTYWENPGDSGLPVTLAWKLPEGWRAGPLQWPVPQKHVEEGNMITYGYEGEVLLLVELTPPADLPSGAPVTLEAKASWLACEKTCVPGGGVLSLTLPAASSAQPANAELFAATRAQLPQSGARPFALRWEPGDTETRIKIQGLAQGARLEFFPIVPLTTHAEQPSPGVIRLALADEKPSLIRGLMVLEANGSRQGWMVESPAPARGSAAPAAAVTAPGKAAADAPQLTVLRALGFGFLGGAILNLMPCVLPVIALKIFGFLGQAGASRERVFRSGLAFVGGIFAWFLGLAGVIVAARASGVQVTWAFQFQNPAFVLGMMLLVFIFALNLLGVFEVWLPGTGKLVRLSEREGYAGAFLHGMFATLLATPCTAPFLGSALAFAFTQNAAVTLAMFAAIAAGMSTPYVLLTARPGWLRLLPKPGMWMVRLKQAFGFLMLGTVVWLLSVLGSQQGMPGALGAVWILLGIGSACWIFGTWFTPSARPLHRLLALAAMAALAGSGFLLAGRQNPADAAAWEPWSPERAEALQKEGRPVFIDFTADWCLNCKYNERFVLDTPAVRDALKRFALLKADWTRGDPRITAELKRLGRAGVPVYAVIPPGGGTPEVLSEILTQRGVLDALERAR